MHFMYYKGLFVWNFRLYIRFDFINFPSKRRLI